MGGRRTYVLVVDDHAIVRQGIAQVLDRHEGLVVIGEADHGIEALDMLHAQQPDVVLVDVNMPRLDGIETTGRSGGGGPTWSRSGYLFTARNRRPR